jgi:hypothetical protein
VAVASPSARHTERAIISSSSVRMTRTATRPAAVEISGAFSPFRVSFNSMPKKPSPYQSPEFKRTQIP